MEIDGNVYRAHVKEKEEAKKEYDAALSSGQTAAHVVQSSRNSNRFTVSVNIESEKKVTFNLTYEELLKRELSVYNHAININPGQIVPDLSVEVYINESSKITTLEVPALKESNEINQENATQDNPLAKIERLSDTSAIIRWAPTPEEQKQLNSEGVKGQLVVRYDVDRESHPQQILVNEGYFVHFFAPSNLPTLKKHVTFVLDVSGSMFGKKIEQIREAMTTILSDLRPGDFFSIIIFSTNVQVNEGYFVHFFAPSNLPTLKKHVTFVLDVSGSMFGKKIEQIREAMTTILSDLRPGDFFSIIIFSTNVQVWDPENNSPPAVDYYYNGETKPNITQPELSRLSVVPVTPSNIRAAKEFVSRLETYSSTNIYGALLKALDVVRLGLNLTSSNDVLYESPEPMIIFLTDGQPNQEESDPIIITDTVTASNKNASAAIFCLAFGDDVDLDFLKKLSLRNSGFARKIYEASDAAIQLQDFYRQVASPLLADVSFNYTESQVEEGSVSKTHFNTLFLGSEFVVAGKLKSTELTGGLTARSPNGTTSPPFGPDIIIEICLPPTGEPTEEHNVTNASFMERLWAYLTIQQLLEKDKVDSPPEVNTTSPNKERALELALKYSFVTPLTSLVVVKPNETTSADTEKGDTTSPDFGGVFPQSISASQSFGGGYGGGAGAGYYPSSGLPAPPSLGSLGQAARPSLVSVDMIQGSFYEELPEEMSTLSPTPGLTIVPLSSLAWLNNVTSEAGITLPTNPQGGDEVLQLGLNQTNSAFSECTTSLGGSGHCRHLPYCALDAFTLNVTDYLPFFCRIDTSISKFTLWEYRLLILAKGPLWIPPSHDVMFTMAERSSQPLLSISSLFSDLDQSVFIAMKTSAVLVILAAVFWCDDVNAQEKSLLASAGESNSPDSNQEGVTENQFGATTPRLCSSNVRTSTSCVPLGVNIMCRPGHNSYIRCVASVAFDARSTLQTRCYSPPATSVRLEWGRLNLERVNPHLRGGRVENHLRNTTPVPPTKIRTSIFPSSAVELNTTSALANYATKAIKPDVYSLHIVSNIQYRYATTVVTSRVANRANTSQEVFFTVVLPETAFISGFLMEIDGNVYRAHVKEKEEAKKEYDAAVSSGQTAAHVVQSSRNSNRFTVSVNIESEKKVTFNLTYEELLKRELSVYNHAININPGQIVPDLSVEVYINESSKITTLEVPALKESNEVNQENATQGNPLAKIERLSDTSAIIRWAPTPEEQKQLNSEGVKGQLVVRYDVDRESHPQQILVNEGYFVHFFAPSNLPTLNKHVTFVLDLSGSMSGRKIEQLREAMTTILSDLRPGDFFSIIIFSTYVQVWDPEHIRPQVIDYNYYSEIKERTTPQELLRSSIVPATPDNIRIAKEFVGSLVDHSSTNIYGALLKALDVVRLGRNLTSSNDVLYENPEPMIIFLTDGQPNEEESDLTVITDTVTASNKNASAAIFCLAFGENADLDFLKKLSLRNSGFARKIYEASDAAIQLQDFYRQVASPLLADVSFNYTESQVEEGSVSKTHFNTLFLGSEFVVTGKLKSTELTGGLTARSPNGTTSLPFGPDIILICPRFPPTGEPTEEHNVTNASFMERLWAYLTIQQLLEKDKVDSPPEVNTSSPNKMKALEIALKKSRSFIEDQLLRNRKTFVYVLQVNCEVKVRYPHPFSELRHSSNSRMRESAVQNNRISEPDVRCYPPTARCYASVDCVMIV
uniref:Inter-alpha-trypsin inhibitor heavy chain H4 n=1 Tax=Timema shepardi TaxID=629360 RepID=A0A7R9G0I1_TIMSH|nr:unnamed protein product [Timema shepardi]